MDEDMFKGRGRVPLWFRFSLWLDDALDWWNDNWDRVTPWFLGGIGTGLLTVMFIV